MGIFFLLVTVIVDSQFWSRVLWPEGEVFWFNTVMNKSSEWGTSPFLWYFYSAMPRAMGFSLFLVPIGIWLEPRVRVLAIPCLVFVLAFSCLPHKELRFIIYVFPLLNVAAAATCARFWANRGKSMWQYLLNVLGCGHLLGNVLVTLFLLLVAGTNYPGGVAMSRLHRLVEAGGGGGSMGGNVTVHIGNYAAQSGVSRFTEINKGWRYYKEDLTAAEIDAKAFSHLLVEAKSKHSSELKFYQSHYNVLEFVECFDHIGIQYKSLLPVRIKTRPCVYILERKRPEDIVAKEQQQPKVLREEEKLIKVEEIEIEEKTKVVKEEKLIEVVPEVVVDDTINAAPVEDILAVGKSEQLSPAVPVNFQDVEPIEITDRSEPSKLPKRKNKLTSEIVRDIIREQKNKKRDGSGGGGGGGRPSLSKVNRISNIKKVIKTDEIRHMAEEMAKLDMSEFCDLRQMSTKECLRKVIDELEIDDSPEH